MVSTTPSRGSPGLPARSRRAISCSSLRRSHVMLRRPCRRSSRGLARLSGQRCLLGSLRSAPCGAVDHARVVGGRGVRDRFQVGAERAAVRRSCAALAPAAASSPWQKGIIVNRGSRVALRCRRAATRPIRRIRGSLAHVGLIGAQTAHRRPSQGAAGSRRAALEAPRVPTPVSCRMSNPRLAPQTCTSRRFKMLGWPRRCTRRILPVS